MKRILAFTSAFFLVVFVSVYAMAAGEISVSYNGNDIEFDVQPQIINDRTMVPLRAIFETLGAKVDWDEATRTISAQRDGTSISMTIDNPIITVDSNTVELDSPPVIVDSRTLVPVRAVAESFDCYVQWDSVTRWVKIEEKPQYGTIYPSFTDVTGVECYKFDDSNGGAMYVYYADEEELNKYADVLTSEYGFIKSSEWDGTKHRYLENKDTIKENVDIYKETDEDGAAKIFIFPNKGKPWSELGKGLEEINEAIDNIGVIQLP